MHFKHWHLYQIKRNVLNTCFNFLAYTRLYFEKLKCYIYIYFISSTGTNHVRVMLRMSVLFWDVQINQHDKIQCYHLGAMVEVSGIFISPVIYITRSRSLRGRYTHNTVCSYIYILIALFNHILVATWSIVYARKALVWK